MAERTNLELQVEQLVNQVNTLTLQVFALEQNSSHASPPPEPTPSTSTLPNTEQRELHLAGKSFLPGVASVCFLLVIALGLRTMTDSGIFDLQIGTLLGMFYASALIIISWFLYSKQNTLAPIFNVCGAVLVFSVTLETLVHFEAFPKEIAYILFAMTGIVLAVISYTNHVAAPILVGTLGMCLAGVALDFPTPYFPYLALLLWLANILAFFASRIRHCSWLRWILLGITLTMLQVWGLRIGLAPLRGEALAPLAPGWFLPAAAIISFTYLSISLVGIIHSGERRISKFDLSLPMVTACYGFLVGMYILKGSIAFSLLVTLVALAHLAVAYGLSRRKFNHAPGTNSFTLAGIVLLSFSLPVLFNSLLLSLPFLSVLALLVALLSSKWKSGGMRISSYLLQAYTGILLMIILVGDSIESGIFSAIFSATICTVAGMVHFRFCRNHPPPAQSAIFKHLDKQDHSAVATLLSGLVSGYTLIIFIAFQVLLKLFGPESLSAYSSIQTVTINLSATVIMILALTWRNRELRNVSIFILAIGGIKVILIDLLSISGLGLVISIFSFGVAASLASFALSRWQKFEDLEQQNIVKPT